MVELLAYIEYTNELEGPVSDRKLRTLDEMGLSLPSSAWLGLASVAIAVSVVLTHAPQVEAAIYRGNTGSRVENIQRALVASGFNPGEIDGIFGNSTEYAVIQFQESRGLFADGIVGVETSNALFGASGGNGDGDGGGGGGGTPDSDTLSVITNGLPLNVRSGPGLNYPVIGSLPNGTSFSTSGRYSNGWVQVASGGWVSTDYTVAASVGGGGGGGGGGAPGGTSGVVATNGSGLNIRSGPGLGYPVVGSLSNGAAVTITSSSDGWLQLASGGWVDGYWVL